MNRWEGLDEFVAVAETGQFTAAAERMGVSSSHISRRSPAWRSACRPACSTAAPGEYR